MAMNFQPWASSFGSLSKIVVSLAGLSRLSSAFSTLEIFESSAMYSVPFLKATPFGRCRPDAIVFTVRLPSLSW